MDFGCGDGGFYAIQEDRPSRFSWLEKNGDNETIGIDVDWIKIHRANGKFNNGISFIVSDGRKLPFKDETFGWINEIGALHHMKRYPEAISEIARVLENGGCLYLREVVTNNFVYNIFRKIAGNWRGDSIESFFSSEELLGELSEFFAIEFAKYHWRSLFGDFLAWFRCEPVLFLRYQKIVEDHLRGLGLDKIFCCQLEIKAIRKAR